MTKFVDQPFETEPADSNGIAVLKTVMFKAANNCAEKITLKTTESISNDERLAKLTLQKSRLSLDDMRRHSGDLLGPDGPFNVEQLCPEVFCAEGTFKDNWSCVPPLPPSTCDDPQLPFDLTDGDGKLAHPQGNGFIVNGTLENFPEGTVVRGLMLLLFR